jgi:hypothetical protein
VVDADLEIAAVPPRLKERRSSGFGVVIRADHAVLLNSATARQASEHAEAMLVKLHPEIVEEREAAEIARLEELEALSNPKGKKGVKKKKGGTLKKKKKEVAAPGRESTEQAQSRRSSLAMADDEDDGNSTSPEGMSRESSPVRHRSFSTSKKGDVEIDEGEVGSEEEEMIPPTPPLMQHLTNLHRSTTNHEIHAALLRTEDDVMALLATRTMLAEVVQPQQRPVTATAAAGTEGSPKRRKWGNPAEAAVPAAMGVVQSRVVPDHSTLTIAAAAVAPPALLSAHPGRSGSDGGEADRGNGIELVELEGTAGTAAAPLALTHSKASTLLVVVAPEESPRLMQKRGGWTGGGGGGGLMHKSLAVDQFVPPQLRVNPTVLHAVELSAQEAEAAADLRHDFMQRRRDIERSTLQTRERLANVQRASRQAAIRTILRGGAPPTRPAAPASASASVAAAAPLPQQQQHQQQQPSQQSTGFSGKSGSGGQSSAKHASQQAPPPPPQQQQQQQHSTGFNIPSDAPHISPAAAARHEKLLHDRQQRRVEERGRRKARTQALAQYPSQPEAGAPPPPPQHQPHPHASPSHGATKSKRTPDPYQIHAPPPPSTSQSQPLQQQQQHKCFSAGASSPPVRTVQRKSVTINGAVNTAVGRPISATTTPITSPSTPIPAASGGGRASSRTQNTTDADGRDVALTRKSNKQLMRNAITHTCLAGYVNKAAKDATLAELDATNGNHFLILLHDPNDLKYRAIYSYNLAAGKGDKVSGRGPATIKASRISHHFRYNSGTRRFTSMGTSEVGLSIDAICLTASKKKRHPENQPLVISY